MRWKLLIVSLFVSVAVCFGQGKGCIPTKGTPPYKAGEEIDLALFYKWGLVNTEVAKATVKLEGTSFNGTPAFHVGFGVKSAPFFDAFFKMREDFNSWFTVQGLRPLKFTRNTLEGKYTATNVYNYDWNNKVIHADVNFNGRGDEHYEIPLHECVYDLPTLIFYLRTMDISRMQKGGKYHLSFAIDDAVFDVVLTYHGKEPFSLSRSDVRDAHLFTCSVVKGAMFEGNQELKFWFSADGNYVPLAVMAPLRWGAVWAKLKDYRP